MTLRPFTRIAGLVAGAALLLATAPATQAAPESTGPELPDFASALLYTFGNPHAAPAGANDWSCRPSARHPRPVVLVHGTWLDRYNDFARLSPTLKRDGYCVFALNYGDDESLASLPPSVLGTADIRRSAAELAAFVDRVRTATGVSQVDIVGHSQGGMMPRQYLRFNGGAGKVHTLVTLGATHHGTTLSGLATLAETLGLLGLSGPFLGDAAAQQARGSDFLATLNADGDTIPGVSYVVIATRYDEVTTPYQSTFLTGAAVRNVTLQDGCPIDLSDHLSMMYSPRAIGFVRQALDPSAPAPLCVPNLPVV